jgi:acyl-CoA thioester hydrolase
MKEYPYETPVEVRFKDVDAMGHVNNAVYITYFEQARACFFRDVFGVRKVEDIDFIVARMEVDYLKPIRMEDDVKVRLGISRVGASSFDVQYLVTANGEPVARGKGVQVFFDYARREKKPVPDDFREKVRPFLAGGER